MLVLSRKRNERILIGTDIEITVVEVHGGKVRLGIKAPLATPVDRQEVRQAVQRDGRRRNAGDDQNPPKKAA